MGQNLIPKNSSCQVSIFQIPMQFIDTASWLLRSVPWQLLNSEQVISTTVYIQGGILMWSWFESESEFSGESVNFRANWLFFANTG